MNHALLVERLSRQQLAGDWTDLSSKMVEGHELIVFMLGWLDENKVFWLLVVHQNEVICLVGLEIGLSTLVNLANKAMGHRAKINRSRQDNPDWGSHANGRCELEDL